MWFFVVGDVSFLSKKFVNIYFLFNYCVNFIIVVYFYIILFVIFVNNEVVIIFGYYFLRIFMIFDNKNVDCYLEFDV